MNRWLALALFVAAGLLSEPITWGFSLSRHRLASWTLPARGTFPQGLHGRTWTLKAQGGQSFVLLSDDKMYVLKLFKDQPRPWLQLPSYKAQKNKKLRRTLTGYSLIYERCPTLSGIVCLHTAPSASIPATIVDRIGIHHSIDLGSYLFVLQQRAEELKPPRSEVEKELLLTEASTLLQSLALCHLKDHDPRLHLNLGKIDGKLTLIDPGRVAECDNPPTQLPKKFMEFVQQTSF